MADLPIYDRTGAEVGKYSIEPTDLAPQINKQLLHDVVVMYQANQRIGSASTRSRSEVAGSTKKLYRQKGTGNARAGSRRSGVRRGGGHIFAKKARDYHYRLPRIAVRLATRMALASKIEDDQLVVIDELSFDQPKTKDMAQILSALGLGQTTTLIATNDYDANVYKSARNINAVSVSPICDLNALCVLSPEKLLVTKAALDSLKGNGSTSAAAASAEPTASSEDAEEES